MDRWEATRFPASAGFRSLFAVCIALCSVALAETSPLAPVPTQRLNLSTVGYLELSAMARRSGQANLSLNFLDTDHVLLSTRRNCSGDRPIVRPPRHEGGRNFSRSNERHGHVVRR